MQLHTRAVDLGDLEVDAFEQAQAAGVDDAQADAVVWATDLLDDAPDFFGSEHDGQLLGQGRADEVAQGPGTVQGVDVEELDGVEGDIGGVGSELSVDDQEQEVLAQFVFGDEVGGFAVVASQLLDGAEVGLLGARARPRSCMSSIIRWRNGVMGTPPIDGNE